MEGVPQRLPPHLVLYDGVCAVCNRTVQWLLDADRQARLHFAPLQGPTAAAIRQRHPEIPADLDSIIYIDTSAAGERVYWWSEALFCVGALLDSPPRLLRWTRWLPRRGTDAAYRLFAHVRYRLFGRLDVCPLPRPEDRGRFLP
jgi:predicted DCC family thiol-disulfide oxidoreductase YuxK